MKQVSKAELTDYINQGKKKDELCQIYGLKSKQVGDLLKEAGLKIKKTRKPQPKAFSLVDDLKTTTTSNVTETIN